MIIKQKTLPQPERVCAAMPLNAELQQTKARFDKELIDNFTSKKRFVAVVGPCSADDVSAMKEYVNKLSDIAKSCPNLLVVARVYTTKPHSNGKGYLGACFHERDGDEADVASGIVRCRRMMMDCLEAGLPVADELLYPDLYEYFRDLVSYWFVGARSSENSLMRGIASGLDVCCGIKNGTDGEIDKAVDSVYAVSNPCVYPYAGVQFETLGCKFAHLTLRGGIRGRKGEQAFVNNMDAGSVRRAKRLLANYGLSDFVMADLSHGNSGKVAKRQIDNALMAVQNTDINGVMMESYLYEGGQSGEYGVSQTDDCLSFDDTETVLRALQRTLSQRNR